MEALQRLLERAEAERNRATTHAKWLEAHAVVDDIDTIITYCNSYTIMDQLDCFYKRYEEYQGKFNYYNNKMKNIEVTFEELATYSEKQEECIHHMEELRTIMRFLYGATPEIWKRVRKFRGKE